MLAAQVIESTKYDLQKWDNGEVDQVDMHINTFELKGRSSIHIDQMIVSKKYAMTEFKRYVTMFSIRQIKYMQFYGPKQIQISKKSCLQIEHAITVHI